QVLPGAGPRRRHGHDLHRRLPLAAGDHAPLVRREADQDHAVARVPLADELADVDLAVVGHVGVAGVADVGVVLPDDAAGAGAVVLHQPLERLGHVAVADVPRLGAAAHHGAVVGLGVLDHQGVLLGGEVALAPVAGVRPAAPAQLGE